jgi:hypothetical protein
MKPDLVEHRITGATGERMAAAWASFYLPYRSKPSNDPRAMTWVQIDLSRKQFHEPAIARHKVLHSENRAKAILRKRAID